MTAGNRDWVVVSALALAAFTLWVVQPALLVFVPLALLLVAQPPRRPVLLAFAMFVGWLAFRGPSSGVIWNFERGWALTLGAWLVLLATFAPGWRFLTRAVATVIGTAATMCVLVAVNRGGLSGLDVAFGEAISTALNAWQPLMRDEAGTEFRRMSATITRLMTDLYPAVLGLQSIAALGVAWWARHRMVRWEGEPLGRWSELRFPDELIWLLIAGLITLVMPLDPLTKRAGLNVLVFMVGLYAVRGAAVLSAIGGLSGPFAYLLGAVLLVIMFPFVMATTLIVGLSDTWLDLRARRAASPGPGS